MRHCNVGVGVEKVDCGDVGVVNVCVWVTGSGIQRRTGPLGRIFVESCDEKVFIYDIIMTKFRCCESYFAVSRVASNVLATDSIPGL